MLLCISAAPPMIQLPANMLAEATGDGTSKAAGDGTSIWAAATQVIDLEEAADFHLHPTQSRLWRPSGR